MEVDITWGRTLRVWWSYAWRNFIAVIASVIAGGMLGFVLGLVMGALGANPATIKALTFPFGFIIGLAFSVVPMRMILGKQFGDFKLALIKIQ